MKELRKEVLVNRIVASVIPFDAGGEKYLITRVSPFEKVMIDELATDAEHKALEEGLMSDSELLSYLYENEMWSESEESKLKALPDAIERNKLELFKNRFQSSTVEMIRKALKNMRQQLGELESKRHSLDYITATGFANIVRLQYSIGTAIRDMGMTRVIPSLEQIDQDRILIDIAINEYQKAIIPEDKYRLMARTEPWRGLWVSMKADAFGIPACEWTTEQRMLVMWSQIYDSVFQSGECPEDWIIEDNDLLDGWMLWQREKREEEAKQVRSNKYFGQKESDEVFIMANTQEDIKRIHAMNTKDADKLRRAKLDASKQGEIKEGDIPAVRQHWLEKLSKERR